ncbi:MAG: type II toxin-antitoxin system PemK/MazF family toxin [Blastocatellia bacterium]
MGRFVKGEVVVIPFPFSDLTISKPRPALVVAELRGDDVILCMITTPNRPDGYSIPLSASDFASGSIHHDSFIRPNRLFTGDSNIITKAIGKLSATKMAEVEQKIIGIITS